MGLPGEAELPLFLLMLLPGFVSLRVYGLMVPAQRTETSQQVLDALAYGVLNLGLWLVPMLLLLPAPADRPIGFWLFMVVVLVVSPVVLGVAAYRVLMWDRLRRWIRHPMPTAWDHFFSRREPCWILFRLRNGRSVAGYYGANSFASSYPHRRDIYVEEAWVIDDDGQFQWKVPDTAGALVSIEDCELIEFFRTSSASELRRMRNGE